MEKENILSGSIPGPPRELPHGDYHIAVLSEAGAEWERCERDLEQAGVPLPLTHRRAWAQAHPSGQAWFLAVRDVAGACRGGFAVDVNRSRALPGHLLLRAERLGGAMPAPVLNSGLGALADLARSDRRVLRVSLQAFARDEAVRVAIGERLAALGFRRQDDSELGYRNTLIVDLTPDEPAILSRFQGMARRNIRAVAKHPLTIAPITEPSLGDRMEALRKEALDRTGGAYARREWAGRIAMSNQHPNLSRIVGLFRTDAIGPESLLAYVWGCHHGDHAHYHTGGSTRAGGLKVPLNYALIWDLICWAKRGGASWFDFGGVTAGTQDSDDPLGRISDFKRSFSQEPCHVSDEWLLEPHPLRARLARALSAGAALLPRARQALGRLVSSRSPSPPQARPAEPDPTPHKEPAPDPVKP